MTGPSSADAAEQVNIIEDLINSGVDAICVVPNDATVLESVLQSAQDKGITVVTTESPDQAGADWDVEMIINDMFAELVAEEAAKNCGRIRPVSRSMLEALPCRFTMRGQTMWKSTLPMKYPDMSLCTDRITCGEDAALARETTLDL